MRWRREEDERESNLNLRVKTHVLFGVELLLLLSLQDPDELVDAGLWGGRSEGRVERALPRELR